MNNFIFQNKTKIIFGKGKEKLVGSETAKFTEKVLLVYGGGSIKKYGLYNQVVESLHNEGIEVVELNGVKPNPRLSLVQEGIETCRKEEIDFILAVGGGSVIDTAKAIGVGVPYEGDVWDFYTAKNTPKKMLPLGVVLTIPAAGSESSPSSVITNEEEELKLGLTSQVLYPEFAIMNPEVTYTLPDYQTACGAADIMAHVMERYFTTQHDVDFTDRLCEAALKTMINNVPKALENSEDYEARAEIMWAGTVAHNGLLGTGRDEDWASHGIEHELSAIYDIAHGAGLAVVFPAWMKYVYKEDVKRFAQFAERVFNIEPDYSNLERTALKGIESLKNFFASIDLPVTLANADIGDERLEEMAEKCAGKGSIGGFKKLGKEDVLNIYKIALK